jgi:hypothetical protein
MSLADLLDPDKWIAAGRKLADFPMAEGKNERAAMMLILSDKPELHAHLERWMRQIADTGRGRGDERIGSVLTEENFRELWEQTRKTALS